MSSTPPPSPGSRKTTVSMDEGARRNAEKTVLGEFRSIDTQPTKRRKKRTVSKPAKWTKASKRVAMACGILLLLAIGGAFLISRNDVMDQELREAAVPSRKVIVPVPNEELGDLNEVEAKFFSTDPMVVASSFANAITVEERAAYVLDASNADAYPEHARTAIPISITSSGMGIDAHTQYAEYEAIFPDVGSRLIAVVPTADGPKVDWDCYARLGTAEWPAILGGGVEKAEVRVVVRPSDYYNFAYSDDKEWLAYEVSSPDLESSVFAYARMRGDLANDLENVFVRSDGKPVKLILRLTKSPAGLPHRQFVLSAVVAEGWAKRK